MSGFNAENTKINFSCLIKQYETLQKNLTNQVKRLGSISSTTNPGTFILIQFQMSQVTQVGESISTMIANVNSLISKAISNSRTQ
jgi:hypothetical protein